MSRRVARAFVCSAVVLVGLVGCAGRPKSKAADGRTPPPSLAHDPSSEVLIALPVVELKELAAVPWDEDDSASFVPIESGTRADGAPTCVIEKRLALRFWILRNPVARVYMFQNDGGVWIATHIVIGDRN